MTKTSTRALYASPRVVLSLFLFLGLFTYAANASATIRYVKATAAGAADGSNWDNASSNLQAIIDASHSGDEVWVAKGSYLPASGLSFGMVNGVKIFGGFAGGELTLAQRDLTITANASILRGNGSAVISNTSSTITSTAVLDGFTITGGTNSGIHNVSTSPTFINCFITGNSTESTAGGGINNENASPILINCVISDNTTDLGLGGGIFNIGSSPQLINCTISGNSASLAGGIYNNSSSVPTLRNTILYGNSSGIEGPSTGNIHNSLIQGLTSTANGNISGDTDPLFVDAANGNYRLQPCSPVINKGSNNYYATGQTPDLSAITTDLAGKPRFYNNGKVDMGAYELEYSTAIIYVKQNGTGPGTSWECATGDLQAAINAAEDGQEVWVAGGTYQPISYHSYFAMKEGVKIYGGFEGNETSLTERDLTNTSNTSTLLNNSYAVVFNAKALTATAVLDGFTITGGVAGGVFNSSASPTLRNCIITGNSAISNGNFGGGIFNEKASPVVINCIITSNTALFGGGVFNDPSSSPILINCTISGNTADFGGGIYNTGSSIKLRNTIVHGNSTGIYDSGFDIHNSLVQGLTSTDNGNISGDTDPLFVDPANGDYRLQPCSPVINKGSDTTSYLSGITTDLAGQPRFYGTVDMGAYEHQAVTPLVGPDGIIYVKALATGTGESWDCATSDLQAAIDAAEEGQEVWVAGGTYQKITLPTYFSMKEGVKIYGGFEGNETSLIQRALTKTVNTSTLLGNYGPVVRNYYNVLTTAAVLDGFTITGGIGSGIYNSSASPILRNCIITGNSGIINFGGGILNENNSSPVLINCLISDNRADVGGGMLNQGGTPILINCTISGNTDNYGGGGMLNSGSSPKLINTIVYGNSSGIYGSEIDPHNSLVQGVTTTDANGNISGDIDPLFVDPANGDYRLQPCSPVINRGSNTYYEVGQTPDLSAITTDLAGEARFYNAGTVDMGAYEFVGSPQPQLAVDEDEADGVISGDYTLMVNGSSCTVLAHVSPYGSSALSGAINAKVWIETAQPQNFVKRHYQLTPTTGAESATAKVTLYFTQKEFDEFNLVNTTKLPLNAADTDNNKANLRIEKRPGTSDDDSGLPASYDGTPLTINPLDPAVNGSITWNTFANRWEVSFDVTGFSGFFAKTTEAALPLNLISFTATKESGVNLLNWKTTNEINTLNFEVQSSSDAKNFTQLTTVPAKGSGNPTYSYQDATPYFGNVYYRLKMVDRDGSFAYSKIISLMNDAVGKATVHPNPAVQSITITISPTLLQSTAVLYDITGRQLQRIPLTTNKQQVDVKSLNSGVYILKFADGKAERFVKE